MCKFVSQHREKNKMEAHAKRLKGEDAENTENGEEKVDTADDDEEGTGGVGSIHVVRSSSSRICDMTPYNAQTQKWGEMPK